MAADHINVLSMQLREAFQSMKQEGMVDDHFTFIYSLKDKAGDRFYLDLIPEFCNGVRDVLKSLTELTKDSVWDYRRIKDSVFKVKGGSLSLGASRMAAVFSNLDRAIGSASKEEFFMTLNQAQCEYAALEAKLLVCLQIERKIVQLADGNDNNP